MNHPPTTATATPAQLDALRRTVMIVAVLNLAYFAIEFWMAQAINSVALFADSIDFLEDASVNLLVLLAIGLTPFYRRLAGFGFAVLLVVPSLAALWTVWNKLYHPTIPDTLILTTTALGALIVNGYCAYLLARVRNTGGSLSKAAFLSARNDMFANIAMIGAGAATAVWPSIWPDVIVGLAIAALNADAAFEVYKAASGENQDKQPESSPQACPFDDKPAVG